MATTKSEAPAQPEPLVTPVGDGDAPPDKVGSSILQALRIRDFRFLVIAATFMMFGFEMRAVAQSWLALELTDSQAWVGAVNGIPAFSVIALSLFGGLVADRLPKRDVMIVVRSVMAGFAFIVGYLVAADLINIWHLMILAIIQGGFVAFGMPANQSFVIDLVGRRHLMSAASLMQSAETVGLIAGPGVAGVLIGVAGVAEVYFFVGTLGVVSVLLAFVKNRTVHQRDKSKSARQDMVEGLRFVLTDPVVRALMTLNLMAMFAGFVIPIIPVYARDVLEVGETGYGTMMALFGAGGAIGTLVIMLFGNKINKGLLLVGSSAVFGLMMALFAFSREFYLSLALLAAMGAAGLAYVITINVLVQTAVPDEIRGRVMSLFGVTMQLFPVGFLFGGVLASLTSNETALVVGGIGVAAPPIVAYLLSRELRRVA